LHHAIDALLHQSKQLRIVVGTPFSAQQVVSCSADLFIGEGKRLAIDENDDADDDGDDDGDGNNNDDADDDDDDNNNADDNDNNDDDDDDIVVQSPNNFGGAGVVVVDRDVDMAIDSDGDGNGVDAWKSYVRRVRAMPLPVYRYDDSRRLRPDAFPINNNSNHDDASQIDVVASRGIPDNPFVLQASKKSVANNDVFTVNSVLFVIAHYYRQFFFWRLVWRYV
jgi:hypothetical protein